MKTHHRIISIILGCWLGVVQASEPSPQVKQAAETRFYCPAPTALIKDTETKTWSAPGGWKSYDLSFVDKITRFSGAQWRGTNVGQIFCVYRGELATSFPILLAYSVLTYSPSGGSWSADLGGYQNCEAPDPADCPFSIRLKPSSDDIYEQAEQLKRAAPKSSRPGF